MTDYTPLEADEFAYDSPRARWLSRAVQADSFERLSGPASWTDYVGDSPYLDFDVTPNASGPTTITNVTRYLSAGDAAAQQTLGGGSGGTGVPPVTYLHGDLIESTVATTDGNGALNTGAGLSPTAYSAFGENVGTAGVGTPPGGIGVPPANLSTRYAYAGGHGYESGLVVHAGVNALLAPITLKHLGARWYQPDIGRFVQRDPIGLGGGINLYVYCANNPIDCVDPSGEGFWDGDNAFHEWIARNVWGAIHDQQTLASMSNGRTAAEAIGASVLVGAGGYYCISYAFVAAAGGSPGWVGVSAGIGGNGLHVTFGSSSAGWIHIVGGWAIPGFAYRATMYLPARFPDAVKSVNQASNCVTGALRAVWVAF